MTSQCNEKLPHPEHEYPGIPFTRTGFQHCLGVVAQQCVSRIPHEGHNFEENGKHIWCRGIAKDSSTPDQKWPCDKFVIHEAHQSVDAKFMCMGITNDEYVRMTMPSNQGASVFADVAEQKCTETASHIPHLWQLTETSSFFRCMGVPLKTKDPRVKYCMKNEAHVSHHWPVSGMGGDDPVEYFCPGKNSKPPVKTKLVCGEFAPHLPHTWEENHTLYDCEGDMGDEQPPKDCGKRYIHQSHTWREEVEYPDGPYDGVELICPGWQAVDGIPLPAITQKVTDNASDQLQKLVETVRELPPTNLVLNEFVPHKWAYHVETRALIGGPDQYHIVRKSEGYTKGQTIAKYENAVYARIVADALNGGILLGFEVGE